MVSTRKTYQKIKIMNIDRPIKFRKHQLYGYCAVPTRIGEIQKHFHNHRSPITQKYQRIFPDGHLGVMDIKENNPRPIQSTTTEHLLRTDNESTIEWLARISKYHPTLEIKITGDDNDFFPSFQLKAVRVFKEYADDIMGCVQLFNNEKPLSVTFYSPSQVIIRVV